MRKFLITVAATSLVAVAAPRASAAPLQIQFNGNNYEYIDGSTDALCDADVPLCGPRNLTADFGDADPLFGMDFIVSGSLVGSLDATDDIGWDFMLPGLDDLEPGDSVSGSGGYLDLYTFADWGLALDLGDWIVNFDDTGELAITGSGAISSVYDQDLPFGLVIDEAVTFSFSGNRVMFTDTGFTASGTGEITAETAAVPEPASLLLIGTGLLGVATRVRRRRQRA